jgi:hypothetical protein
LGLLAIVTTAILSGCATAQPVLRLSPLSENMLWIGGTAAIVKEASVARVAVAFARQQEELVSFRVEIENTANVPMIVSPTNFYYATCTRLADGKSRQCSPARWAVNPEKVLLDLDIARSRQKAGSMNDEALVAPLLFLDMATAMMGLASGDHRTTSRALGNAALASGALASIQSDNQQQASAYELERANWETAALRKTTLLPGNRVAGLVFVARDMAANEVSLQIRLGDEILDFPFKQVFIDAVRHRTAHEMFPDREWRGQ